MKLTTKAFQIEEGKDLKEFPWFCGLLNILVIFRGWRARTLVLFIFSFLWVTMVRQAIQIANICAR